MLLVFPILIMLAQTVEAPVDDLAELPPRALAFLPVMGTQQRHWMVVELFVSVGGGEL